MISSKTAARSGGVCLGALGLLLASCVTSPEIQIHAAPSDPVSYRQYGNVIEEHHEAASLVKQALEARGGFAAEDGWRVQTTLAVRPVTVGAYSDTPARDGEWSEAPRFSGARRGSKLHVLSVVLEKSDGSSQRVVQVSGRSDDIETPRDLLVQLVDAASAAAYDGMEAGIEAKRR